MCVCVCVCVYVYICGYIYIYILPACVVKKGLDGHSWQLASRAEEQRGAALVDAERNGVGTCIYMHMHIHICVCACMYIYI